MEIWIHFILLCTLVHLPGYNCAENNPANITDAGTENIVSDPVALKDSESQENKINKRAHYNVPPPPPVSPPVPPPPVPVPPPAVPTYPFPYPFFPGFGFNKGFDFELYDDFGGVGLVVKKITAVIGGGIIILLVYLVIVKLMGSLGIIQKDLFGLDFSHAFADSKSFEFGPFSGSAAAAASFAVDKNDPAFFTPILDGIDHGF